MITLGSLFSGIGGFDRIIYRHRHYPIMSNGYTYKPPCDEIELYRMYVMEDMTQCEIAKRFGVSQHVIFRALKKMGIQSKKAIKRNQFGENNSSWKGGRVLQGQNARHAAFVDSNLGYWYIYNPNHPHAQKGGYVAEHILVALKKYGKGRLEKGELVHHINLNKQDNNPNNLTICKFKNHALIHKQLEAIAIRLMEAGYIEYDDKEGYKLSNDGGRLIRGHRRIVTGLGKRRIPSEISG